MNQNLHIVITPKTRRYIVAFNMLFHGIVINELPMTHWEFPTRAAGREITLYSCGMLPGKTDSGMFRQPLDQMFEVVLCDHRVLLRNIRNMKRSSSLNCGSRVLLSLISCCLSCFLVLLEVLSLRPYGHFCRIITLFWHPAGAVGNILDVIRGH